MFVALQFLACIASPSDFRDLYIKSLDHDDDGYLPLSEGGLDCNDDDVRMYPGNDELCDGVDNNCNGLTDEGWYVDADGDGYYSTTDDGLCLAARAASQDQGDDCNDDSSFVHPDAPPSCNPDDDLNCNGIPDDLDPADTDLDGYADCLDDCAPLDPSAPWQSWPDADEDGFGNEAVEPVLHCEAEEGFVDNGDDCNDQNDALHPNTRWYLDTDGDGFGTEAYIVQCDPPDGYARYAGDCNDEDVAFHPGAPETDCTDPNDYNCDGSTGFADDDGDGWPACEECDDADATINPDGTEVCDDADNNCDGVVDEDSAVDAPTWYADTDQDTYGDVANTTVACEAPTGFVADSKDCDDDDKDINPAAQEVCDEDDTDEDCDGTADDNDGNTTGQTRWFDDADSDNYGDAATYTDLCEQPSGTVTDNTDCDDGDDTVYPAASELCDGQDNDCDNSLWGDEEDDDGDGAVECSEDSGGWDDGSAPAYEDCDDGDDSIYVGATELCDGQDNDCDNAVPADEVDNDGDGAVECAEDSGGWDGTSAVTGFEDCDDADDTVYEGATEVCDGTDNDCDGAIPADETDDDSDTYVECSSTSTTWTGSTAVSVGANKEDCDDSDSAIFPGASEVVGDDVDDDCDAEFTCYVDADGDGQGDSDGTNTATVADTGSCDAAASNLADDKDDCDDADDTVYDGASELCDGQDNACSGSVATNEVDNDGDGYVECTLDGGGWDGAVSAMLGEDCDDGEADINPGASEVVGDDVDDDCDSEFTCYVDDDGDGQGNEDESTDTIADTSTCDGGGVANDANDCDDGDATIYNNATELCDGQDNDCDGALWTDETDDDSDFYVECAVDSGGWDGSTGVDFEDCDDTDSTIHPDASELCDGQDNDCDSSVPTNETDDDGDSFVECAVDSGGWDGSASITVTDVDCDDTDATVYPSATELCDGQDNDCDSTVPADEGDDDADSYIECTLDSGGWDGSGSMSGGDDCDDGDSTINPGATMVCDDGIDNDCGGIDSSCLVSGTIALSTSADATLTLAGALGTVGVAEDWKSDGTADLLVVSYGTAWDLRYYAAPVSSASTGAPVQGGAGETFALGLWDSDGLEDILTENYFCANGANGCSTGVGILVPGGPIYAFSSFSGFPTVLHEDSSSVASYSYLQSSVVTKSTTLVGLCSGDLDQDGKDDVFFENGYFMAGTQVGNFDASTSGTQWSTSVDSCTFADLDGDGYEDLVSGRSGWSYAVNKTRPGAAWVLLGSASVPATANLNAVADARVSGYTTAYDGAEIGYSVAVPGDVDGDGYNDLLVGAPGADEAYLFYGPVTANVPVNNADATFQGSGGDVGDQVGGAHDLSGDARIDLFVTDNSNQTVYLVFGGGL